MNNIKKMILGFAAVAMIVSFSAFKNQSNKVNLDTWYYAYDIVSGSYQRLAGAPDPDKCEPDGERCLVQSETNLGENISVTTANSLQAAPGSQEDTHYAF